VLAIGVHICVSGELRNVVALGAERYVIGGAIIAIGLWMLIYGAIPRGGAEKRINDDT